MGSAMSNIEHNVQMLKFLLKYNCLEILREKTTYTPGARQEKI